MADQVTVRQTVPTFSEIGRSGLKESGGWIYEDFIPSLRWPKAGQIFQEMSYNDPVITAILLCSRQLIRNVNWTVEAASDAQADQEAAQFLRDCMGDMSTTWADFVDELTSCFEYGWSYHEIVYKRRLGDDRDPSKRSKFNDGRIGWRKIPGRSQTSLMCWLFSDDGSLRGMEQYAERGTAIIPIEKALLFRTTSSRGNPEGRSFLRGAYRPWYFKKHIEEIEGIGIERDLAGLPVINVPEGVDINDEKNPDAVKAKNTALKLVSSIRRDRNEGVVLPFGWELELLSSKSTRQFNTNEIINRYDQRIAITMLADIVMLGADKVGSFALAKVKQSMLAAALNAQLINVSEILNAYAVPRLFALNIFPGITKLPQFKPGSVVAPDLKELGDYIKVLAGTKMPIFPDVNVENYLRRVAGLPETSEEDENRQANLNQDKKEREAKTARSQPQGGRNSETANPDDTNNDGGEE